MASRVAKLVLMVSLAAAAAGGLAFALKPKPVSVDLAEVTRGPMQVTVDEEAKTRIKEVFVVSAPVTGKLMRIALEPGDEIKQGETVVAVIQPMAPPFLDVRTRREHEAHVAAASAGVSVAESELRQAEFELGFAQSELQRARTLARAQTVSERALEKAELEVETRQAIVVKSKASLELRKRELESQQAHLIGPEDDAGFTKVEPCCVQVRAPVSGRVTKLIEESEKIVLAGAPLVVVGDPRSLEILVELLSTDAVKVQEGARARVEGWGGRDVLAARVRRIEPSGFTKVSALGIEEQRVRVLLDFVDGAAGSGLGDDFRVYVRIVAWEKEDVVRVPLGALFRRGDKWAVFKVTANRAEVAEIEIEQKNAELASVIAGLEPGERVILHPSDRVADGVRVEERRAQKL